jgi:succinate-semialdehyde dehydrogenase/glutarate-semialdehyde dehydrogenase
MSPQASPTSDAPIQVVSPVTGEVVGTVPRQTPADVAAAVEKARAIQPAWAAMPPRKRGQVMLRFLDVLLDRQDEIKDLLQRESGKARRDAFAEVFVVAGACRYFGYHGPRHLRPRRLKPGIPLISRARLIRKPMGVVGIIGPWNYPLILTVGDAIPALVAGNGVVIKPASLTPLSAIWGMERLVECGLPEGLLQVVTGSGAALGDALIDSVDCIAFTGSTATGRRVAARAAERLIPFSMELGGKNAMIVLADADPAQAADGAIDGAFGNCGQVCLNIERAYVEAPVYDAFVVHLVEGIGKVRLGAPLNDTMDMGSVISQEQLDTIERHVKGAVEKGATLITGGRRRPDIGPLFYEPTVLAGVTPEMEIYREETFGPVLSVYKVSSREEALRLANDSHYGLNGGVWTRHLRRGEEFAERVDAGTVCVNDTTLGFVTFDAPMGGFKDSGIGRRHGPDDLRRFTQPQAIVTNKRRRTLGSGETALAAAPWFVRLLTLLMKVWRRFPFFY